MQPWAGSGVVVAVSGGADSVALLRGLDAIRDRLGIRLAVATLDHSTRAGESACDAAFVAGLAARLGLSCDVGRWQSDRPGHFEADARRARYAWLLGVARERGAAAVAVGHTRDDQAETILHRVVRGTGLRGLAGMAARRSLGVGVDLIRPILGVGRHDLRDYLAAIGQDWREDASNRDEARTRARIRHDLLPKLAADYNPAVAEALVRLGRDAAGAARAADRRARRRLDRVALDLGPGGMTFDRAALRAIPPAGRVDLLRLAWRRAGWPEGRMTRARWERLGRLAGDEAAGPSAVGGGVEAVATPDRWTLRPRGGPVDDPAPGPRPLAIPGAVDWPGGRVVATLDAADPADEWVDLDRIAGPLTVRSACIGDRLDPLGLDGRTQPLADFLRGRRVARADRPLIPVVADAGGIVWVAGHRIAHRVRRTATTTRTLGLRFDRADSAG